MILSAPGATTPADDEGLWRYQDIAKFLVLLSRKALFFPSAASFNDPWEGAETHGYGIVREVFLRDLGKMEAGIDVEGAVEREERGARRLREEVCVSSWHMNNRESAAMWGLYCRTAESVAIRTSVGRLRGAFSASPYRLLYGAVDYVEYASFDILPRHSPLSPYFRKRLSFQHEREFRVVATSQNMSDDASSDPSVYLHPTAIARERGAYIGVAPDALVEAVYVAPTAPHWMRDVVSASLTAFGFIIPVHQSELDDAPIF